MDSKHPRAFLVTETTRQNGSIQQQPPLATLEHNTVPLVSPPLTNPWTCWDLWPRGRYPVTRQPCRAYSNTLLQIMLRQCSSPSLVSILCPKLRGREAR